MKFDLLEEINLDDVINSLRVNLDEVVHFLNVNLDDVINFLNAKREKNKKDLKNTPDF